VIFLMPVFMHVTSPVATLPACVAQSGRVSQFLFHGNLFRAWQPAPTSRRRRRNPGSHTCTFGTNYGAIFIL